MQIQTAKERLKSVPPEITSQKEIAVYLGVSRQHVHQLLNPERHRARLLLLYAVRKGEVVKPDRCSLCKTVSAKIQGHHSDYNQPLKVEWFCPPCHKAQHPVNLSNLSAAGKVGGAVTGAITRKRLKALSKDELSRRMRRIALGQSPMEAQP